MTFTRNFLPATCVLLMAAAPLSLTISAARAAQETTMPIQSSTPAATAASTTSTAITTTTAQARQWFQDARFGMFIHWGVYSMLANQEWVMENEKITVSEYEKLPRGFYPADFDAEKWVSLAKSAGMKYITFTSRHHDSFSMWDSQASDYNIVKSTPFARDVLKELADECRRQDIKLFLYYSHLDWRRPDYFPRGLTGNHTGRPESGNWNAYLDFVNAQLTELLTNYGPIAGIWFDGHWDKPDADWRLDQTYKLIHDLQPAALIGNNHHLLPFPGEDFQMYERDLPGHNTGGFSATSKLGNLPLETCDTMNGSWGFTITDRNYKSTRQLIHYLVRSAGYNANFLLNVGPTASGVIPHESASRLQEMGQWMKTYGESIYGASGGPIPPQPWGVTTAKAGRIYVHVLEDQGSQLEIPALSSPLLSAKTLKDGSPVTYHQTANTTITLNLPPRPADEIDQVIVLETNAH